ncbi:MAG: hypothetical protein HXY19_06520 [Thermoanaerobaculaceae bacterium]|jgi:translation initiation factor 2 beta subunit (eIF-2beta)/eIF-5|nr:hypothetical protein [Thermoanaerobaculaceae bacterium]
MAAPDYLVCLECETPTYTFEWREGRIVEALCMACGNDDPSAFATEDDLEEMALRDSEREDS